MRRFGMNPAEPALGLTRGIEQPVAASPQPYSRSSELSDLLTHIARSKGLLSGPAIDVYVSNKVTLIQGAVGTPGDCVLLARVLALQPEVQQIDNRLVAVGLPQTRVENRGGGKDRGHPDGSPHVTGIPGSHHEPGSAPGKTADAAMEFSSGPISIVNPATNSATVAYSLGGSAFTIPPGYGQNFHEDRARVIRFSPGANRDEVQYRLHTGLYTFTSTDHGWELHHSNLSLPLSGIQ